ncbi:MAG: homoserine dehydrogenase [Myxococcales bacterium]|nr:homoserine dehydrogenase [Myxococcales bacterium]
MRDIGVGLLGLGNVGAGVVRLLYENATAIEARLGARLVIRGVAVRDLQKTRLAEVDASLLCTDPMELATRDGIDIVCELIGGEEFARDVVLAAIAANKQIVTANKALLAVHGEALYTAAEAKGVDLYYEAAVCGGIPIIRALREGLASDRVESITGIVNGTSNFITSAMASGGSSFEEILATAQREGYAEADPTLDVSGGDAAHKLAILAMLCFGTRVQLDAIHVEGIETLAEIDYAMAKKHGYVIKSLAMAKRLDAGIELRVHPAMVPQSWLLADVPDTKNAVYVDSYALGSSMYYGAGAGMMPTAMSVVSDLIEIGRNICANATGSMPLRSQRQLPATAVVPMSALRSHYYLRFSVEDRPGTLGKLTTILGEHRVSIANLSQRPMAEDTELIAVVALTHEAIEGDVQAALSSIADAGLSLAPPQLIRIAS